MLKHTKSAYCLDYTKLYLGGDGTLSHRLRLAESITSYSIAMCAGTYRILLFVLVDTEVCAHAGCELALSLAELGKCRAATEKYADDPVAESIVGCIAGLPRI